MTRECHVRICGGLGGKFPGATRRWDPPLRGSAPPHRLTKGPVQKTQTTSDTDADADAEADASEEQKLADKAARAKEKAKAARELAIEKANEAGLEPQGLESQPADAMPYRGLAHRADGSPTARTQRNFTDPDSHIVKSDGNVLQGYNCQAVVDGDHQVIVAMGVSNQPPDVEHLVPMLVRTIANTSQVPKTLIADAGYWSEDNAKACEDRGVDPHIATGRLPHGQPPPPIRGPSWRPSEWCNSPGPQPGVAGLSVRTSGDRLHG